MLQGEADYRCPALNTEQFYTMLKVNGCTVEMVRFPNSAHAESIVGEPITVVRKMRAVGMDEKIYWSRTNRLEKKHE